MDFCVMKIKGERLQFTTTIRIHALTHSTLNWIATFRVSWVYVLHSGLDSECANEDRYRHDPDDN
jgi:hypothetical protein